MPNCLEHTLIREERQPPLNFLSLFLPMLILLPDHSELCQRFYLHTWTCTLSWIFAAFAPALYHRLQCPVAMPLQYDTHRPSLITARRLSDRSQMLNKDQEDEARLLGAIRRYGSCRCTLVGVWQECTRSN